MREFNVIVFDIKTFDFHINSAYLRYSLFFTISILNIILIFFFFQFKILFFNRFPVNSFH